MNLQRYDKEELYPTDFTDDNKLNFDILLEQAKQLFPKLSNDIWLIKGVRAREESEEQRDERGEREGEGERGGREGGRERETLSTCTVMWMTR